MKIKTKLGLNSVISLVVVMLMILSLAWIFWEIDGVDRNKKLIDEMRKTAYERILLRDDYLLHREERAAIQWVAKTETLRGLMKTASERLTAANDKALMQEAQKDFNATFSGFSAILEKDKREGRTTDSKSAFDEAESKMIGQVFLKAYTLQDSIERLYESTEMTAKTVRDRGYFLIVFFVLGGGMAIAINSFLTGRFMTVRLQTLHEGVHIIGGGNLDYRIATEGNDELAELASESNKMAANLKVSLTSIDSLNREIAVRKRAEEELRRYRENLEVMVAERTAQLSAANKELEAVSYSLSHDLRTPLRSIDGFSHALLEEYQDKPLDDQGKTYLERVRKAAQQMGFLNDGMLNLLKVIRHEFKRESFDLSNMVRDLAETFQKSNPDRIVDVTVQEGVMVQGDSHLLKIAMENLVDNAFKFTGKEAHPRIEFGTAVRDGETACFIRDNGAGFDMAYVGKLFSAFQRLHTADEYPGTGIGLATVQRIIHRHEGRIWAEGEVGKGAKFYFTVPS